MSGQKRKIKIKLEEIFGGNVKKALILQPKKLRQMQTKHRNTLPISVLRGSKSFEGITCAMIPSIPTYSNWANDRHVCFSSPTDLS